MDGEEDELDRMISEEVRADPRFAAALGDAQVRSSLMTELIQARHAAGLSQAELGELMGVRQPTLSEFEAESTDPRLSSLQRYARALGGKIAVAYLPPAQDQDDRDDH